MQGNGKIERDYSKAKDLFNRVLVLDKSDASANYNLGLMHMLGLGEPNFEKNIPKAMEYFKEIELSDAAAMNAIGVLYYQAPDVFEKDPAKKVGWGSMVRDIKKAWSYLEKATAKDSLHASFNLGCLHLD